MDLHSPVRICTHGVPSFPCLRWKKEMNRKRIRRKEPTGCDRNAHHGIKMNQMSYHSLCPIISMTRTSLSIIVLVISILKVASSDVDLLSTDSSQPQDDSILFAYSKVNNFLDSHPEPSAPPIASPLIMSNRTIHSKYQPPINPYHHQRSEHHINHHHRRQSKELKRDHFMSYGESSPSYLLKGGSGEVSMQASLSSYCPDVCTCKWKNGKKTVICSQSSLEQIPSGLEDDTQVLILNDNDLSHALRNPVFSHLKLINLQKIHLSRCKIIVLGDEVLASLTNLIELDLSENYLESVPTVPIRSCPYLRRLSFHKNFIRTIDDESFPDLDSLQHLDLSDNRIEVIESTSFANLIQLRHLSLNNNKLRVITGEVISPLINLQQLNLHGNPWVCDCLLRDVRDIMMSKNIPLSYSPTCDEPDRLHTTSWSNMTLDEFACSPTFLGNFMKTRVQFSEGDDASMECLSESVPLPAVSWTRSGQPITNLSLMSFGRQMYLIKEQIKGNNEKSSRLIIMNVLPKDAGRYQCRITNKAGSSEESFYLEVGGKKPGKKKGNLHSNVSPTHRWLSSPELIAGVVFASLISILLVFIIILFVLMRYKDRQLLHQLIPCSSIWCKQPPPPPGIHDPMNPEPVGCGCCCLKQTSSHPGHHQIPGVPMSNGINGMINIKDQPHQGLAPSTSHLPTVHQDQPRSPSAQCNGNAVGAGRGDITITVNPVEVDPMERECSPSHQLMVESSNENRASHESLMHQDMRPTVKGLSVRGSDFQYPVQDYRVSDHNFQSANQYHPNHHHHLQQHQQQQIHHQLPPQPQPQAFVHQVHPFASNGCIYKSPSKEVSTIYGYTQHQPYQSPPIHPLLRTYSVDMSQRHHMYPNPMHHHQNGLMSVNPYGSLQRRSYHVKSPTNKRHSSHNLMGFNHVISNSNSHLDAYTYSTPFTGPRSLPQGSAHSMLPQPVSYATTTLRPVTGSKTYGSIYANPATLMATMAASTSVATDSLTRAHYKESEYDHLTGRNNPCPPPVKKILPRSPQVGYHPRDHSREDPLPRISNLKHRHHQSSATTSAPSTSNSHGHHQHAPSHHMDHVLTQLKHHQKGQRSPTKGMGDPSHPLLV